MKKIAVLGAGLVGKHMAIDLCRHSDYEVTSVDRAREQLDALSKDFPIKTMAADLSSPDAIEQAVADADVVVGAVPGFLGYSMLESVIRAGKDIVDISFFEEDPFGLDDLAKEKDVTAVVDCGVAPGMANIILGDHTRTMNVRDYRCYVGGLPKTRRRPFEYKAPFSPIDVIAEYTRPARVVEHGKEVVKPALSDVESMDFDGVGTLEAFNTDGLRSLLKTMDIPNMLEKTLRYPGHADLMRVFRDTGFFDETPIQVKGHSIRPVDMTAALIFPQWKLGPGEVDFTLMKVILSGEQGGKDVTYTYDLYDEYDPQTDALSMARTTGYTCTAVTRMVLDGDYSRKGISPPEYVGRVEGCLDRVLRDLKDRGIEYRRQRA